MYIIHLPTPLEQLRKLGGNAPGIFSPQLDYQVVAQLPRIATGDLTYGFLWILDADGHWVLSITVI